MPDDELKDSFRNSEKDANSADANLKFAKLYFEKGMMEEAEQYFLKALKIEEHNAVAHNHLGILYFSCGKLDKAEHHFKTAIRIDPLLPEIYFNLGVLYQRQGRFQEALSCYKEVLKSDVDDAEVYYLMGQCAQCSGMLEEAELFFAESFRLSPSPKTALDLSILYISQEKYEEAQDMLKMMIEMANSVEQDRVLTYEEVYQNEMLYFTMGLILQKQKKFIEAMKYFHEVIKLNQNNEQAYNHLGECCVSAGLIDEAEALFAKAIKIDPQYMRPLFNLGMIYYNKEEFFVAGSFFERYMQLVDELSSEGQDEQIQRSLPEFEQVCLLLGKIYLHLGKKEKAVEILQRSLRLNPNQPEVVSLLNETGYEQVNLSID